MRRARRHRALRGRNRQRGLPGGYSGGGGGYSTLYNPCPYTNDGECDEPGGTNLCAPGTDSADCQGGYGGGEQQSGGGFFADPELAGRRVDWCLTWGANCGQPAADRFCQQMGYARASGWNREVHVPTYVLGDGQICMSPNTCHALSDVSCTGSGGGGQPPAPPAPGGGGGGGGSQSYPQPTAQNLPVDWCLSWGADCGQPSADYYCRAQGYDRAVSFSTVPAQMTRVQIGNQVCNLASGCHALSNVVCAGSGGGDRPPSGGEPPAGPNVFHAPSFQGTRIDWCAAWGDQYCGQYAADLFCQSQRYAGATSFERDPGVAPTISMQSGQICNWATGCVSIRNIVCH